jgi:excisionase family DNA binding protein
MDNETVTVWLTPRDVAAQLLVSRMTVHRWIDEGKLAAVRIDRVIRIRQEDLDALIANGSTDKAAS